VKKIQDISSSRQTIHPLFRFIRDDIPVIGGITMNGYAGKILNLVLSKRKISIIPLENMGIGDQSRIVRAPFKGYFQISIEVATSQ
jgi:hypothetical protein